VRSLQVSSSHAHSLRHLDAVNSELVISIDKDDIVLAFSKVDPVDGLRFQNLNAATQLSWTYLSTSPSKTRSPPSQVSLLPPLTLST
jgi:hypothetical protein